MLRMRGFLKALSVAFILSALPLASWAQLVVEGTATTAKTANGTTLTANAPASIASGDLLVFYYIVVDTSKSLTLTGWTSVDAISGGEGRVGAIWKIASAESGTVVFDYSSGSSSGGGVMVRYTGHDATTPLNSNQVISELGSSQDPFVLSAGTITGAATDSHIVTLWGSSVATRTITTLDADQTLLNSATAGASGFSVHTAYETGVTQNSAYSTDMNDSRDYVYGLFEIQAAADAGPTAIIRRRRAQ